jgi:Holliday junction DNA helicase RuvA
MISFLTGKILEKEATKITLGVNGVGYEVFLPTNTLSENDSVGANVNLFIVTIVREDLINLFGFSSKEEKKLFNLLISINKIGPKIALGIMSSISPAELQNIIISNNQVALSKLPGIGPKGAAKIILELKDKINQIGIANSLENNNVTVINEAVSALNTLGFSNTFSQKSVSNAYKESNNPNIKVEELIRLSLKHAQK